MALAKAKETHTTVKTVKRGATVKKYAPCQLSHEPNEETKQAMRDVDAGIGLTTYNSVDELWAAMQK